MAYLRKYGVGSGADIYIPMIKRAVVDFAVTADWTPASGDVKISIDGGAAANIGTLPVVNGTHDWKFVFSDAELQGKVIRVRIVDSATKAVEDQSFTIETYGHASAMYQADLSAANLPVNVIQAAGTAWASGAITAAVIATGAIDADAIADNAIDAGAIATDAITSAKIATGAITSGTFAAGAITSSAFAAGAITSTVIAADAIGASELAADAVTEIQSGLATAASIAALNNLSAAQVNAECDTAISDAALVTKLDAIQADLPQRVTKNTALAKFPFKMVDSTDHITAETGLTVTATRSLDGAAFGACANAVSEIGTGWYYIDLAAGDLNGNTVILKFTATGADTREITIVTQPT